MRVLFTINEFTLLVKFTETNNIVYWFDNGIDVTEYMDRFSVKDYLSKTVPELLTTLKEEFE